MTQLPLKFLIYMELHWVIQSFDCLTPPLNSTLQPNDSTTLEISSLHGITLGNSVI